MRLILFVILFVCIQSAAFSQADSIHLKKALSGLNDALIKKDSVALKNLLDDKVTYGHSSGWIQSKDEVIKDLFNGKVVYNKIDILGTSIQLDKDVASVRSNVHAEGLANGNAFQLNLQVLQVWIYRGGKWLLLSRQGVKI